MKLKQPDINGLLKKNHKVSKPTPMMAQYLEVKERHKEYLLFYRMGDFYELFFEDAEVAASNLGIALTKRGKIGDKDIPMCGVPYHSAQTYLSRLIKQGFKVAIAEQLGESEEESKSQKIFKRDVVRIITPGTIIEDSLLDSKNNNNLLSIFLHKGLISIAWVDMTSGLIKLERIEGKNFLQYLTESIHKIEPGEIIVSEEIKNSKILNEKLGIFDKQISYIPHTFYDHRNNTDVINNFFDIKKIQSLADLNQTDIAVIGALINYLKLTQKNNIPKIRNVEIVSREKFMQIDMFTLKSLEIFERYDGVKKGSLIDTIDKTQTACGARMLRYFLKAPLIDNKEIEFRHNLIESFLYNFSTLEIIIKLLASVPDLERALARVTAGTNNPRDLILIKQFINFTKKIFRELENVKEKNLHKLIPDKKVIDKATTIEKLIDENIEDTPPINLNDGGVIKGSVDKRLDELRNIKQIKTEEIIKLQEKYSLETNVNNLKIKFNNFHGYFIEVTKKHTSNIDSCETVDFIMIQNTVNASRYQTEELRKISHEIESSVDESIELELKIYEEICLTILEGSDDLSILTEKMAFVDVISNFAHLAELRNYIKPKLLANNSINILNGRHPVVEEGLKNKGEEFTPNNCEMNEHENIWLMTGPNMAGKSTFLRQIAIIALLNQIGSYVPAEKVSIGVFDKIFTRIGASDNLSEGMSTFMMEMIETSRIVNEATKSSLVILDELGRGTSSEDGLAIAYSVLEFIALKIKCLTLFATHYKDLCEMSDKHSEILNKTLAIKKWNNEIIFHYKVIDGISEGSFGIHVANLAGINKSIISRASQVLKSIDKKDVELGKDDFDFNDQDEKKDNEVSKFLQKLDLDNLSPKESLDILYALKKNYFIE